MFDKKLVGGKVVVFRVAQVAEVAEVAQVACFLIAPNIGCNCFHIGLAVGFWCPGPFNINGADFGPSLLVYLLCSEH